MSEITTPSQTAHDVDHGDFDYDYDYVDAFLFDYTTMMAPVTSTTTTMLTPVITTTQTLTADYQLAISAWASHPRRLPRE